MAAYLGDQRPEQTNWLCGYAPEPGDMHCNADAEWHGFLLDDALQNVVAMMTCCTEHLPIMKLTADYIHRLKHPCCIPGAWFRWPENECYTDWDEVAEFAAAMVPALTSHI